MKVQAAIVVGGESQLSPFSHLINVKEIMELSCSAMHGSIVVRAVVRSCGMDK